MLKPLLEKLRRGAMSYRWGFPLQLTIRKDNSSFTVRCHADLPDMFTFLDMELFSLPD